MSIFDSIVEVAEDVIEIVAPEVPAPIVDAVVETIAEAVS
jgi:hypothetical protein